MIDKYAKNTRKYILLMIGLFILLLVMFVVSINTGFMKIPLTEVWSAFFGHDVGDQRLTLFEFRLPRIILAMLIGAGIAVAGGILQGITKNPLADPGIIGINAGASFAVVLYTFLSGSTTFLTGTLSIFVMPFTALVGAFIAAILIYTIARRKGAITPIRLILVGIGINAAFASGTLVLQMKMDPQDFTKTLTWISGSIWATNWDFVLSTLIWLVILIPLAIYKSRFLNVFSLGDSISIGLGVPLEKERLKLLIIAVGLAGSCVAVGGGITFLGLIAPHIARRLIGSNHGKILPLTALLGACILLIADTLARVVMSPMELPVGIVIAILGAPYFIYLLMKV
ncbi:iron complex transport system permease protein [Pullulanibacillus pueri]|uniref:Iron(3+)-hydroxamate import system permease protein FhuG n=1 Tax=Pullulanibacillus pueri TaxID=1437324 RepID=A0A8J2ZVW2_9BACL|nr:iron ABC transporter permease [Pullulanibacillus pueri]MBM7680908.1 iron complex transport system permease protein [Pullulanibacillus pueri]GGH81290.1 iron(3+)-hydroxamate import system permease protein FhuG [Pullulanibacillus pueri]